MRKILTVALMLSAAPVAAQTVIDGSDAKMSPELRQRLMIAAQNFLREPERTKIRNLRQRPDGIWCAEANTPNKFGGMTGFQLMTFNPGKPSILTTEWMDDASPYLVQVARRNCGE